MYFCSKEEEVSRIPHSGQPVQRNMDEDTHIMVAKIGITSQSTNDSLSLYLSVFALLFACFLFLKYFYRAIKRMTGTH